MASNSYLLQLPSRITTNNRIKSRKRGWWGN